MKINKLRLLFIPSSKPRRNTDCLFKEKSFWINQFLVNFSSIIYMNIEIAQLEILKFLRENNKSQISGNALKFILKNWNSVANEFLSLNH